MKKNIIKKGMALIAVAGMLTGCSDSYLSTEPVTDPSGATIANSVEAAKLAVRGIARAMNCQYSKTKMNQYNGESYVNTLYNDGIGQDCYSGLGQSMWGAEINRWNGMGTPSQKWFTYIPWNYGYNLVYMANNVLAGIDTAEGLEADKLLIKAQALTYRAHGYVKLMQFYGPRWEDSNNGEEYCIVLRTEPTMDATPLVTVNVIKNQIYNDLTEAIRLYDQSGKKRDYKWEPSREVACGLYARAAMLFHDYEKAEEMAKAAQEGFSVMDNTTLFAGFYADNDDFMWQSSDEDSDIYYWSFGSHYAANGLYVKNWDNGSTYISLDLYNQLDPKDVRRGWFLTPDKLSDTYQTTNMNPGKLVPEDCWDPTLIDASTMNMALGPTKKDKNNPDQKFGLPNFIFKFTTDYLDYKFKGDRSLMYDEKDPFAGYCAWGKNLEGGFAIAGTKAKVYCTQIGAQYKFWSKAPYGTSYYPFMRCAEMVLTQAEAAYYNGHMDVAKQCLEKIQRMRIPGYAGAQTGEALLDEIRLCRRIEMWGEGMSWSDLKRWNLPCVRRPWKANDPTSGNIGAQYQLVRQPSEQAGWRFVVPNGESEYNNLIDRSLLPPVSAYTDYQVPD